MSSLARTHVHSHSLNTELTTVLMGKEATLPGSTLSGFLNTTNDFVYNSMTTKIDLSKNTSNE
jgi:hypothetical protein